jgi:hypothetical protein
LALALFALFVSGAAARGSATTAATGAHRFLWGGWIGKQFTGTAAPWDWNAVKDFEARNAGGRQISVIHWGVRTPWEHPFNHWVGTFNDVQGEGALSLVDMDTGRVPLRAIANGAYDSALQTWASQAASWGQDFFLRFDWEMNGRWYPWGTRPSNKNTPGAFVAAWRHVHNIFSAAGATNVQWVWCPNYDPYHVMTPLAKLYPGKAYVDWTCLDGYNRDTPWTSFNNLYASTYREVTRLAPSKPLMLGEVASTEHGGSKAQWIRNMFRSLLHGYAHVHALVWWDQFGTSHQHRNDWPLETSNGASVAFSRGLGKVLARACRRLGGEAQTRCLSGAIS